MAIAYVFAPLDFTPMKLTANAVLVTVGQSILRITTV